MQLVGEKACKAALVKEKETLEEVKGTMQREVVSLRVDLATSRAHGLVQTDKLAQLQADVARLEAALKAAETSIQAYEVSPSPHPRANPIPPADFNCACTSCILCGDSAAVTVR